MTTSERFGAAAADMRERRPPNSAPDANAEQESAPVTVSATSSSALLDARLWSELSPWRISAAWSLAAAALVVGIGELSQSVSPQTLVLLFLLVDPLWGNIWGGLATPEALPRIRLSLQHRRPWLPYLTMGSPAARVLGMHGPSVLAILTRAWLPCVAVAFAAAAAVGMPAVWATLAVLGLALTAWLQRHVALIPASVLHSLVVVAAPWFMGLTLFGLDPWNGLYWALILLWTLHVWCANSSLDNPGALGGLAGMAVAQAGIALLLIFGRAPLALAVLCILWLATWVAVYRGQPLQNIQASWTAALLVSAAAM
ncbi:MAG: hypothetical protein OXI80_13885 [Caldilineaceae bacterium]|nr:hypothetical protein [Caldilineaceae bacterium]MDE0338755.1 hypothetical protein [Caldilineaceae bacterium]